MSDLHKIFMTRTGNIYRHMKERFAEKRDKKDRLIRIGRELPFDLSEFRDFIERRFNGATCMHCCYCPRLIDYGTFVVDHDVPVERGGGIGFDNLQICCADCNNVKGRLLGKEFIALMKGLDTFAESARKDILKRLRLGAQGARLRFFDRKKKVEEPEVTV